MFRILMFWMVFVLAACNSSEPGPPAQQTTDAAVGGAPNEGGGAPNEQLVACLNRFREKRYDEAITVCGQALRDNPGDPQILKAIELSQDALKENGGTAPGVEDGSPPANDR